ncbi:mitochondrial carrier [Thozetella sp. PMI_491]|nr:mitochondrial carrier [Thozetella sp. PMI_491]
MKVTDVASELALEMKESQNQRDKRVEELWRKLDPSGLGELDFKGLQKGLQRIDHPMKNAGDMLKEIIAVVDTNGDGKIQFDEFRVFVEAAEKQLFYLFQSIDRDHDGKLDPNELQAAFKSAGLTVPRRRLAGFFDEIDMNHDGYISFDEWRDFLLFLPQKDDSALEAALSFYSDIVTLNAEGDSMVSDQTLEGLGTTSSFLLQTLFGSILRLAAPEQQLYPPPSAGRPPTSGSAAEPLSPPDSTSLVLPDADGAQPAAMASGVASLPLAEEPLAADGFGDSASPSATFVQDLSPEHAPHPQTVHQAHQDPRKMAKPKLTDLLPEPGYFLAGAVSGAVSRTATAPLDRLKVALLVQTKTIDAVNLGQKPLRPIRDAIMILWRAGGIRTFFAGNGLNVVKIMPESAIRFGSYEASKRFLATFEGHNDPTKIGTVSKFVAGGIGGMTAQLCVYPIDTLKFRLQCETVEGGLKGNALLLQTAKNMWKDGGFRAAYRGLGLGLIGMFPYSALDIGTFEFLKKSFTRTKARYYGIHEEDAAPGNVATAILGASSGAFGATVVYPLNVLRTRLQTQGTAMHPPTYTGIWDVAQKTIQNEGARGLYKGLTPNILKVAPALSITWVCYENMKKLLDLH